LAGVTRRRASMRRRWRPSAARWRRGWTGVCRRRPLRLRGCAAAALPPPRPSPTACGTRRDTTARHNGVTRPALRSPACPPPPDIDLLRQCGGVGGAAGGGGEPACGGGGAAGPGGARRRGGGGARRAAGGGAHAAESAGAGRRGARRRGAPPGRYMGLLTRRARIALGTATQCTRINGMHACDLAPPAGGASGAAVPAGAGGGVVGPNAGDSQSVLGRARSRL
jgi:hypothetical protein